MNTMLVPLKAFLKQQEETTSVIDLKKDRVPGIPPENDMIKSSRIMDSRFACHGEKRISKQAHLSSLIII
jgi:hypothetical protein